MQISLYSLTYIRLATSFFSYDQQALSLDFLELLERFIPSDYEMKLLENYVKEGRSLEDLSEEDRFIMSFGKIPRLAQRISTLTFMGNFPETVKRLQPVSRAVMNVPVRIKCSPKSVLKSLNPFHPCYRSN